MHKLLERQLRRQFGANFVPPPEWAPFLETVSQAYEESDADRARLERAMELSSQELGERFEKLAREVESHAKTELALGESEARYRLIVETATEGICIVGADGRISFANRRAGDLLGVTPEELVGSEVAQLMAPEARQAAQEWFAKRRTGDKESLDLQLTTRQGRPLWVLLSSAPIEHDGQIAGALILISDITARKEAEAKLQQAYAKLQDVDRFRAQFLNNAAHELGTPLTPITIQLHLLESAVRSKGTPDMAKSVATIQRNVDRVQHLVQDILDAARVQAARLNLRLEAVDLDKTIHESIDAFTHLADRTGVKIDFVSPGPVYVSADARRLGQVIDNLLGNAVKFSPPNGRISIHLLSDGARAVVTVADQGIGMRDVDIERLFRPFSQVHDSKARTFGGTGLGLYISKGIIEDCGGQIGCQSAGLGQGSTFHFALHVVPPPALRAPTKSPVGAAAPIGQAPPAAPRAHSP
ncbi:MAG: PAS domain-containing sensor histidine kinase [Thermoplasmatota archaeon]